MILPASYSNGFAPRDGQPLYPELWRNCVSAWNPCLGPSGLTLRDWSGFGNHGTLTNMDAASDWVPSQGRYALDFDGSNDRVAVANNPAFNLTNAVSVSAWIYQTGGVAVSGVIVSKRSGFNATGIPFELVSQALVASWRVVGNTNFSSANGGSITLGQWMHLCGTWDGATRRTYLNGVQVASAATTGTITNNSTAVSMGTLPSGTDPFFGNLDDIRVYSRSLSANEVRLLATRRGIAYELAPRRRSRVAVITSGFSALRPSILRGSR